MREKKEELERMTLKLEGLNPHEAFVSLKKALAIPKLQYVLRSSLAYLCKEELRIFDRTLFNSLGRVTHVLLEGDAYKQAGFPVSFGCRRAGDIVQFFFASMNCVDEFWKLFFLEQI